MQDKAIVIITGQPGILSGGYDLKVMMAGPQAAIDLVAAGSTLARRMLAHPQPIIVACPGHAVAKGAFVLLSADYRIGVTTTDVAHPGCGGAATPENGNLVLRSCLDAVADGGDLPGELAARRERWRHLHLISARHEQHVGEVHRGRPDADHRLAGTRCGVGQFGEFE